MKAASPSINPNSNTTKANLHESNSSEFSTHYSFRNEALFLLQLLRVSLLRIYHRAGETPQVVKHLL